MQSSLKLFCVFALIVAISAQCNRGPLRLNHLQGLGTHNSYHLIPNPTVVEWEYEWPSLSTQLNDYYVRFLELDVGIRPGLSSWRVWHYDTYDEATTCQVFKDCLRGIKDWVLSMNRNNYPVLIYIEFKTNPASAAEWDAFDNEILSVWNRDWILKPDDVRGNFPSLNQAITHRGWPEVDDHRGKIWFAYDSSTIDKYVEGTHQYLRGRLGFIFHDFDTPATEPNRAIIDGGNCAESVLGVLDAIRSGFIVRCSSDTRYIPGATSLTRDQRIQQYFTVLDLNHDNFINKTEVTKFATEDGDPEVIEGLDQAWVDCGVSGNQATLDQYSCISNKFDDVFFSSLRDLEYTKDRAAYAFSLGGHFITGDYVVPKPNSPDFTTQIVRNGHPQLFVCNPILFPDNDCKLQHEMPM